MSEQIMNIPLCFYGYAMVQQQEERQEDGKGKRREPSLFLPCPLIFSFSARTHSNTHTEFKLNPKNFKSEHVVREREWGIWPWYFYFNMCTCKGQKKGRKANNAGSSWKKNNNCRGKQGSLWQYWLWMNKCWAAVFKGIHVNHNLEEKTKAVLLLNTLNMHRKGCE